MKNETTPKGFFGSEPSTILIELRLIRKRLGWALFWLFLIALGIINL